MVPSFKIISAEDVSSMNKPIISFDTALIVYKRSRSLNSAPNDNGNFKPLITMMGVHTPGLDSA